MGHTRKKKIIGNILKKLNRMNEEELEGVTTAIDMWIEREEEIRSEALVS
jgi:hypothetical protein